MGERFGRIERFGRCFRVRADQTQWTICTEFSGVGFIGNGSPARSA
jgi:hypothetical protein